MAKLINEPVRVHCAQDNTPEAFIWRKRLYRVVEVLSRWQEPADWWNGKPPRLFVRVNARNNSIGAYELYLSGDSWVLHRVLD